MLALVHPLPQPTIRNPLSSSSRTSTTSSRKRPSSSGNTNHNSNNNHHHHHHHHHSSASQSYPPPLPTSIASSSTSSSSSTANNSTVVAAPKTPTGSASVSVTHPTTSVSANPTPSSFDIHSYHSPDLLKLLASLLTQIAATNDSLTSPSSPTLPATAPQISHHAPIWQTLTTASRASFSTPSSTLTFHARNVPTISLEAYLLRILKYCPTTNEVFLSLLVYFDRMSKLAGDVTGRPFVIDSYNIHRLVIAGVTVASKFFSDVFYTNSRYAKVGGLPQAELNQLELQFLLLNDFRLVIPKEEMQRYAEQLILFSQNQNTGAGDKRPSLPVLVRSPQDQQPMSDDNHAVVARPCATMGAIDAYGGSYAVSGPVTKSIVTPTTDASSNKLVGAAPSDLVRTPNARPSSSSTSLPSHPRTSSTSSVYSYSSTLSEEPYDSETDDSRSIMTASSAADDTEEDDEPTIRPAYSADNRSLCSFDSATTDEREGDFVPVESEEETGDGEMTPERRANDSVMESP